MARLRFAEPAKFLPVAFSFLTILGLYLIYVFFHCIPMLQLEVSVLQRDWARWYRGAWEIFVFHILTCLLLMCYFRSILEDPGEIPENDPNWAYNNVTTSKENEALEQLGMHETKKGGGRRHCKWCGKFKPDRCHHCRVCRSCILKMDHHCPWIYNCVGFNNYKFFYLLLLYCVLTLHLIMWTMWESVMRVWDVDTPFATLFFVLFGMSLSIFLGCLLTVFFGFHNWLMLRAMTTIEFCEKKMPKEKDADANKYHGDSVYDLGCFGNIQNVLGKNPLIWLVPLSPHDKGQNGLYFKTADTRLSKEFDAQNWRTKGHQRVPRRSDTGSTPQNY